MATTSTDPTVRPKSRPAVRGTADGASGLYPTAAWRATFTGSPDAHGQVLRSATPTHLRGVGGYVVDRMSAEQLAALGEACALIAAEDEDGHPAQEPT